MQTRSSSRLVSNQSSNPTSSTNPNPKGRNRRYSKQRIENLNLEDPVVTMADQRTMAQLLQAPTEGYEDAIVVPAITADNFELKHGLITLVQNKQFFGHNKEDPHAHIRYFNKITSTLKFPNVLNTLRNEITNFQQRFDESFSEAWDRFKDLLRACPHHGFLELHQLDTFYNALNSKDQDSLNSAAGGNYLDKMPRKCLAIIESKSKVCYSRDKPIVSKSRRVVLLAVVLILTVIVQPPMATFIVTTFKNLYLKPPQLTTTKEIPAINRFIPNQNRGNNFNQGLVYQPPVFQPLAYQAPAYQAPAPQTQCVSKEDFLAYVKANDAVMKNMQTQGTLPSNMIANPKSVLKAITTRSGVSYDGPEVTKDTVNPTNNGNTEDVQPQAVQSESPVLTSKPVTSPISKPAIAPVSASKPNPKASIPYPSKRNDERNREKANNQIEKFHQIFKDMSFEISFADALILMPKIASTLKALIGNKEKLSEMARTPLNEHCSAVLLKKLPKNLGDPCKFLILCDFPVGVAEDVFVKVGSFHFLADFVVVDFDADPRVPLILERSFLKTRRALIDVFECDDMTAKRIDVIDMVCEEYSQEVLGFFDTISSGNPTPYYDLIVSATSSTLTPFGNSDFLLEEVDAFLAIEDEPTSSEFHQPYLDPEGDILLLEAFLNDDPSLPPPNQRNYLPEVRKELKICKARSDKSSVDEPPVVELKGIPPHLEYVFLEGDDKLPIIIVEYLSVEEKTAFLTILKSHKRAIAWKLSDIKGTDLAKITKKGPKPDKIKHEIVKIA
uniref:Reverse transcriptase domain-containing protein n=1 Tax=Tanacetum cinerariifolium TaxID=118510 RepID=A0A6L2KKC3_TANCI|nr:reverse transcriptase domain-containing protein [Tanacetum cinerariifolium]